LRCVSGSSVAVIRCRRAQHHRFCHSRDGIDWRDSLPVHRSDRVAGFRLHLFGRCGARCIFPRPMAQELWKLPELRISAGWKPKSLPGMRETDRTRNRSRQRTRAGHEIRLKHRLSRSAWPALPEEHEQTDDDCNPNECRLRRHFNHTERLHQARPRVVRNVGPAAICSDR